MKMFMTENYCDECDDVLNVIFDEDDFYSHKVGAIRCHCGCVSMPCNECENHENCENCPWKNAKVTNAMTDEEYERLHKEI